jgi:GH15 family glucan-1,4-alpha-glucosidase
MFGVLDATDQRLAVAMEKTKELLTVRTPVGGIARYDGDKYYKNSNVPQGNPWIITSLWWAQYAIARARTDDELDVVRRLLERVARFGGSTGILPEQLDPETGAPVSASPLAWSHAEYLRTVVLYLERCKALGVISEYRNY